MTLQNSIKSNPDMLARRIYTVVTNKNLQQTHLEELYKTFYQMGYKPTLIKGIKLTEKYHLNYYESQT